jgi:hypothetical protein
MRTRPEHLEDVIGSSVGRLSHKPGEEAIRCVEVITAPGASRAAARTLAI